MRYASMLLFLFVSACGPITPSVPKTELTNNNQPTNGPDCSEAENIRSTVASIQVGVNTLSEVRTMLNNSCYESGDGNPYISMKCDMTGLRGCPSFYINFQLQADNDYHVLANPYEQAN